LIKKKTSISSFFPTQTSSPNMTKFKLN